MSDETYNGWEGKGNRASAYATWRVCLELVDPDYIQESFEEKPDADDLAGFIEEYVREFVFMDDPDVEKLVSQYADAFLDDVSWDEIAEHVLIDWPDDDTDQ